MCASVHVARPLGRGSATPPALRHVTVGLLGAVEWVVARGVRARVVAQAEAHHVVVVNDGVADVENAARGRVPRFVLGLRGYGARARECEQSLWVYELVSE